MEGAGWEELDPESRWEPLWPGISVVPVVPLQALVFGVTQDALHPIRVLYSLFPCFSWEFRPCWVSCLHL